MCELHFTALLAMREGYVGGALTLIRPTFECLQRAIWLHNDHDAVADFRTGAVPNFSELRAKIAEKLGTLPGPFGDFYDSVKTAHALTHGGRELVTAHFADSKVRTLDYQLNLLRWFKGLAGFAMQLRGMIVLRQSDLEELQKTLLDGFP